MGVYIKGMEMPKNCDDCLLDADCPHDQSMDGYKMQGGRPRTCPLVPIPPHGRLIDADEFLKRAIGTKCFRGDYALMLEELVGESTTILEAEEGE